jgi:hypothetical protein
MFALLPKADIGYAGSPADSASHRIALLPSGYPIRSIQLNAPRANSESRHPLVKGVAHV